MKIAIVSPHPDDAEVALGASIRRWSLENEVTILVCIEASPLKMNHSGKTVDFEVRQNEQIEACKILGADAKFLYLAPASKFDDVPISYFVSAFDGEFINYEVLYIPLPSHAKDHCVVWEACIAALRPTKLDKLSVYAYEQPTQGHGPQIFGSFVGKKYLEISSFDLEVKCSAISMHTSQMNGRENTIVGIQGVKVLASMRGMEAGVELAEMVYPLRSVERIP